MTKKKILITTGGGDCPGLNAVIRAVAKAAKNDGQYEVWGSMEAYNGILNEPVELVKLTKKKIAGIHVKGGTIIRTTNKGNPLEFPIKQEDGTWKLINRGQELVDRIHANGFTSVINIGGDGSQKIGLELSKLGLNVIGVPKTIDNDLSATEITFGFNTAVQIATDCFDKLVTTAESHHRVMIMEVMGRDAGWIALHTAIAGGAEICLIPEIPYDISKIVKAINKRYRKGRGFVNIVISEGARPIDGEVVGERSNIAGDSHIKLGGIANYLRHQLEESGCIGQVRSTVLGHIQRGGTPSAFDRILATSMGVKAFEMVKKEDFGKMVSFHNNGLTAVPLKDAVTDYNFIDKDHYLISTARKMGIKFGD
ncbi:MAG: phosphofructokinase-like protein [Saprospiraceae bacterium]|jgi:phosphofructokinase-like protein